MHAPHAAGARGADLLATARQQVAAGNGPAARTALRSLVLSDRTFRTWLSAARLLRSSRSAEGAAAAEPVRVALLGTSTLDQVGDLLSVAGLAVDLTLEVYTAGYGQYETEVLDPGSGLYAFDPHVVVLAPDVSAVHLPLLSDVPSTEVEREVRRWTSVWAELRERCSAHVLQLNFVPPYSRPLGSLEAGLPGSRRRGLDELNQRLAHEAGEARVSIVDASTVAQGFGLSRWRDDRYWFHAKQPVSLAAVPVLTTEIAAVVQARLGRSRKVLVTDLDNTLWGGVVGEDGVAGLQLSGTPVGEAHLALQAHLLDLKSRGVLLAVSSKNDEATARAPFLEREDMLLSLDDFAGFVTNWSPKDEGLQSLADQLGLGLDSFVFLDDNPAERALVRERSPQVDVLELPEDAAGYLRVLTEYPGFEPTAITAEDSVRTAQYRARAAAVQLQQGASSLDEYLSGLDMVADFRPIDETTLPRVAQLIGKTNQWNLTTRRHSPEALQRMADDPAVLAFSVRLQDRFADHGLVALAIAVPASDDDAGTTLEIDTLLMSCRVIGRTLEWLMLDEIVAGARDRGVRRLRGVYRPTERNGQVADLYRDLGFTLVGKEPDGTTWELATDAHPTGSTRLVQRRTT